MPARFASAVAPRRCRPAGTPSPAKDAPPPTLLEFAAPGSPLPGLLLFAPPRIWINARVDSHRRRPRKPNRQRRGRSPLVVFHRVTPGGRLPQRADRSAAGSLPTRAFRYCEPSTSASGYGYYIFPPIGFSLKWDGHDIMWTFDGAGDWLPLKSAQFPDFATCSIPCAPEEIRGILATLPRALQEPGLVQIWTGIVARTAPGWSLMVRPPVNHAAPRRL